MSKVVKLENYCLCLECRQVIKKKHALYVGARLAPGDEFLLVPQWVCKRCIEDFWLKVYLRVNLAPGVALKG
jgi:hypothetical protein